MRKGQNIYKRQDGRWEAKYKDGYMSNGKPKYKSVYGKTYSEAREKRDKLKAVGEIKEKYLVFSVLFERYMKNIKYKVKDSTFSLYYFLYEKHLSSIFAGVRVSVINNEMINNSMLVLLEKYTPKYVKDILVLFMSVLKFGIDEKYIKVVFKPINIKIDSKDFEIFTIEEQTKLESYLLNRLDYVSLGILLCLSTGLRIGELCGLKLEDINLQDKVLYVSKTLQRIKNTDSNAQSKTRIVIDTPKSRNSIREVPIPDYLVTLLKMHSRGLYRGCYLLTGKIEKFLEPRSMQYHFEKILKACQIDKKNFHCLRHTFATRAIQEEQFDLKTLSEILGHSDIQITLRKYIHSNIEVKKKEMKKVNSSFLRRQFHSQSTNFFQA